MKYLPSAVIGLSISMIGIIVGNMAVWKMMDAYEESLSERSANEEMFMTGEVANPGKKRVAAGNWYRKTHPMGSFLKLLRYGQLLTVAGFLVTFALLAI